MEKYFENNELDNINNNIYYKKKSMIALKLVEDNKIEDAINVVDVLIEMLCILLLKRIYNVDIDLNKMIYLYDELNTRGEEEVVEIYVDAKGMLTFIVENDSIQNEDIKYFFKKLDELLGVITRKYKNFFR